MLGKRPEHGHVGCLSLRRPKAEERRSLGLQSSEHRAIWIFDRMQESRKALTEASNNEIYQSTQDLCESYQKSDRTWLDQSPTGNQTSHLSILTTTDKGTGGSLNNDGSQCAKRYLTVPVTLALQGEPIMRKCCNVHRNQFSPDNNYIYAMSDFKTDLSPAQSAGLNELGLLEPSNGIISLSLSVDTTGQSAASEKTEVFVSRITAQTL
ncbi:hypothetical protein F2P81_024000 [Scophthalmus maximus]|uniref:Uncharacterized protein n=1 Tax=Scophthalmus maximus TaxID=52904 RepID=A0A6A4RVH8_SCOMX|nr:hypothetical protein F2P81_024000 [Scophthalmus maximus]